MTPFVPRSAASCAVTAVRCYVCGADDAEPVTTGQDYEYQTIPDVFRIERCRLCGLYYLNPRPSLEELPRIYPEDYYSYTYQETCHPIARAGRLWLDKRKAKGWLGGGTTRSVLDVGCGDGRYLRLFRSWGVAPSQLWGTELDGQLVARLKDEGFQAREGTLETIPDLPKRHFDLIVMLQLIEHLADPLGALRRTSELLAPDGVLVIETPNIDSWDPRLFRSHYWGGYHFPRHWTFFNEATLARLALAAGLQPLRTRYLPSPVFWVYSLHHLVKYGWERPGLARLLNPFRSVPAVALATAFDIARAALSFKTSNMQMVLRAA